MQSASCAFVSVDRAGEVAVLKRSTTSISIPGVKPASALEIQPIPDKVPFGITALDQLTGGIPRGALTEILGPTSSGRTSVTLSLLAQVTGRQEVCAVIDATDSFDPSSAAAAGVDLKRVLWVRCGTNGKDSNSDKRQPMSRVLTDFSCVTKSESNEQRLHRAITSGCFEAARSRRGPESMNSVAPPAKNISWSIHENYDARLRHAMVHGGETRESWSKQSVRNTGSANRDLNVVPSKKVTRRSAEQLCNFAEKQKSKWNRLDQALKATDLLIQGGGFGLIVIDLGDVSPEQARRIPLTSWFRFRRAVENTRTILLLIARASCAKTCASLVMELSAVPVQSGHSAAKVPGEARVQSKHPGTINPHLANTPRLAAHVCLLDGLSIHVQLLRTRLERKPVCPAGADLETRTLWKRSG